MTNTTTTISHIFVRDADDASTGARNWALVRNGGGGIGVDARIKQRVGSSIYSVVAFQKGGNAVVAARRSQSLAGAWRKAVELVKAERGEEVSSNVEPLAGPHHFNVDDDAAGGRVIPSPDGGRGIRCIFPASIG